ncbi:hypothetical protein D7V97_31915 [Corallococcus sp. CA053C]|uniref:C80 family cysteine peptidase n=1 Tax=Corallococcus sp. CA053C TaxID=2316732 RepID=UPI000EA0AF97|nr:C80 family cysteine peptidase [Corallococcus sp. CA053C]RKG99287.1 hypothetical protein D7V97_31915 [Corallococcus sp. CA053C]
MYYLHDFQCPSCKGYFNEITLSPVPSGDKWCNRCGVACPHDETYLLPNHVPQQPQQPLPPVSRYDRQLVVKLTNTSNYGPVDDAGTALHNKATRMGLPSEIIELDGRATTISTEHKGKFESLTNRSRLYIVGHGQGSTIQGVLAFNLAFAVRHQWGVTAAFRITLVSCKAGDAQVDTTFGNFAKDFHHHLRKTCRIITEVAAYTRSVSVATAAFANSKGILKLEGRKTFYKDEDNLDWMKNDGDKVKIIWFWDDQTQSSRTRSEDRAGRKT